jgi:hypothetical protein
LILHHSVRSVRFWAHFYRSGVGNRNFLRHDRRSAKPSNRRNPAAHYQVSCLLEDPDTGCSPQDGCRHTRSFCPKPDSAHRIWPGSFRDWLRCDRNVLDVDRVAPDAHAGRMPNRVGDRTDCTGDADLADALHAKRVDVRIVFMDEDRLD